MRYKELIQQARSKIQEAKSLMGEDGTLEETKREEFDRLMAEADDLKTRAERLKAVQEADQDIQRKADEQDDHGDNGRESKAFSAAYRMRFGDVEEGMEPILNDVVGRNYKQVIWEQERAFERYCREGEAGLDRDDVRLLKTQIFPLDVIKRMVTKGMSLREIKATMVEAQGTLGGYAVPPQVQAEIIRRLPGETVVRKGGARVITLMTGNSTEFPKLTGGDDRYTTAIRGQWGSETQDPNEQNATLGMVQVNAHTYTYKVPLSQSLVEDAQNLMDILQAMIAETLGIDEDDAFLVGDGAGKPLGILPGGVNGLGLTEVVSGSASAITADGLKQLKRGVASQYRRRASFVANSSTYEDVELLKDANNNYLFPDLSDNDQLLGRPALESEAMPDVAANAFPLVFGDLSGYWIVERSGLTIRRFQDSNTGINKVEFHVRRRVGGRVAEPWKFAVQKVSA